MSQDSKNGEQDLKGMEGHCYDGIVENDNPMPDWWIWSFLLCIVFALLYSLHYMLAGGGPTLQEELKEAMLELEKHKTHEPVLDESEQSLEQAMGKDGVANLGATAFAGKCAVCHGPALQGQIGPNLTDAYWLHGKGTRLDIVKAIRQGVPDKGMPAWGPLISKDEIYSLAAFILSKKGSNPGNPKAPQGELVQ